MSKTIDADAAFAHLTQLLDELPAMQLAAERLRKATTAREALLLSAEKERLQREFDGLELAQAEQLAAAQAAGDLASGPSEYYGKLRYTSELLAVRRAPLAQAARRLASCLSSGGLAEGLTAQELSELALPDAEYAGLEQQIAAYQADFFATQQLCEQYSQDE